MIQDVYFVLFGVAGKQLVLGSFIKTQLVTTIRLISNEYLILLFEYFKNK